MAAASRLSVPLRFLGPPAARLKLSGVVRNEGWLRGGSEDALRPTMNDLPEDPSPPNLRNMTN